MTTADPAAGRRLDSWKQIAAYIGRDIRTAQLWEKKEGLPVRRLAHTARANVFAYTAEIDAWREQRERPHQESTGQAAPRRDVALVDAERPAVPGAPPPHPPSRPRGRATVWLAALAGVVALGGTVVTVHAIDTAGDAAIAVLPFEDLSTGQADDHLADGLTDDIINALGRAGRLPVISRTSTSHLAHTPAALPHLAATLHAGRIVEGSLQRDGHRVRITAELIDARTDRHLWAQSYERELSDVLSLQDDVATAVSAAVLARLTGQPVATRPDPHPVNPQARLAYLTGRVFWARRNEAGLRQAIASFNDAIAADPTYAPAYSGLADAYTLLSVWGSLSSRETFPKAKAAAERALALDSTSAEAFTSLAIVTCRWDWQFARADSLFRRAIAANPNYATAHQWYGEFLGDLGRADSSIAESRRAVALDPLSPIAGSDLAATYMHAGRPRDAVAALHRVLYVDPDFIPAHNYLGSAYAAIGDLRQSRSEMASYARLTGDSTPLVIMRIREALAAGRRDDATHAADALLAHAAESRFGAYQAAEVYLAAGDTDRGFAALERAYREHSWFLVNLGIDDAFAPVRGDPRYESLRRRVGLPR